MRRGKVGVGGRSKADFVMSESRKMRVGCRSKDQSWSRQTRVEQESDGRVQRRGKPQDRGSRIEDRGSETVGGSKRRSKEVGGEETVEGRRKGVRAKQATAKQQKGARRVRRARTAVRRDAPAAGQSRGRPLDGRWIARVFCPKAETKHGDPPEFCSYKSGPDAACCRPDAFSAAPGLAP